MQLLLGARGIFESSPLTQIWLDLHAARRISATIRAWWNPSMAKPCCRTNARPVSQRLSAEKANGTSTRRTGGCGLTTPVSWDERDVITYALATGYARAGVEQRNLRYVYERDLVVVPSFATALARNGAPTVADLGGDYSNSVLASVHAQFLQPLPAAGTATATSRVRGIRDRGRPRGALIELETILANGEAHYARVTTNLLARADGGCGQLGTVSEFGQLPDRAPDHSLLLSTRPDQAALYRLLGDFNPLHIDPVAAQMAGFTGPILHGLCSYGIALQDCRPWAWHCNPPARAFPRRSIPAKPCACTLGNSMKKPGSR